jgi:dipeptidyl aminopeptidase/acylaminoacyl peptidase
MAMSYTSLCARFAAACALASLLAQPVLARGKPSVPAQAAAPAPPPSRPGLIPVEEFAELPVLASAMLSPDGRRIAARVSTGKDDRIGIWTVGGPAAAVRYIPAGNATSFQWAGDNKLLINVSSFVLLVGTTIFPLPVRRVALYDLETNRVTQLSGGGNTSGGGGVGGRGGMGGFLDEVIFVDPGARYVLLSTQVNPATSPSVRHVDLVTGRSVEVQPARRGVWNWFADARGVVRVGVDYGERRTRIYYRAAPGAELRLVDTHRNVRDDSVVDMIRFVDNTQRGIVVTNAETGRFGVYEYDFSTDTRGATVFEHPEVDVTAPIFAADGSVDGIVYDDDRPRVHWIDPDLAAVQQAVDRALSGKTNTILNSSRDGNRLLVWSSAPDDPGTYYVYDRAARRMEMFASPYEGLHERRLAPVRPVSYQSRDGLRIGGYLTLPPGAPERGLPLVVLPHGGPFLRDRWVFDQEVQFLASRGYAVLQPNFRGSTGYGREFVAKGYGQLGGGMIDDMDDGVEWLVREGIADPARVCIMGSSYGGYAATWAAMRSPERYRCAISWAGPSDLRSTVRHDWGGFVPQRYVRQFRERVEGEERIDLNAISPLRQVERLRVPLLIGHGDADTTVPADQSRRLVAALTRRGNPPESVFYPEAGHGFTNAVDRADWMRRVEAFLARHNPAGPAPAAAAPAAAPAPAAASSGARD